MDYDVLGEIRGCMSIVVVCWLMLRRSSAPTLWHNVAKVGPLSLACDWRIRYGYLPSERNPADAPNRAYDLLPGKETCTRDRGLHARSRFQRRSIGHVVVYFRWRRPIRRDVRKPRRNLACDRLHCMFAVLIRTLAPPPFVQWLRACSS